MLQSNEDYKNYIAKFKNFYLDLDLCSPNSLHLSEEQLNKLLRALDNRLPPHLKEVERLNVILQASIVIDCEETDQQPAIEQNLAKIIGQHSVSDNPENVVQKASVRTDHEMTEQQSFHKDDCEMTEQPASFESNHANVNNQLVISIKIYTSESINEMMSFSAVFNDNQIQLKQIFARPLYDIRKMSLHGSEHQTMPTKFVIIIVDDDLVYPPILRRWITDLGDIYTLYVFNNGQEVVDFYTQTSLIAPNFCHLIFMDSQMPILDGAEATKQIRAYNNLHELRQIPIIGITAVETLEHPLLASGADELFKKPVTRATIISILEKYKLTVNPASQTQENLEKHSESLDELNRKPKSKHESEECSEDEQSHNTSPQREINNNLNSDINDAQKRITTPQDQGYSEECTDLVDEEYPSFKMN